MARACLAVLFSATALEGARISETATFGEYAAAFGRSYAPGSPEYELRRGLFEQRAAAVQEHNKRPGRLWTAGLNALTDLTAGEFRQRRGWRASGAPNSGARLAFSSLLAEKAQRSGPAAKTVDWTQLKSSKDVHDQGSCGSCWALASASMLAAHHEIHMLGDKTFSAQELVNCVPNPGHCGGDGGCAGATVELAMAYVQKHGLRTTEEVPYEGADGKCLDSSLVSGVVKEDTAAFGLSGMSIGLLGWAKLPENKALPLMQALMDGPVGISVGAAAWQLYESGIFNDCTKDVVIDHAVLLLGYGEQVDSGNKFWTVQNSWGPSFGESGRIRLHRQDTPELEEQYCGVDSDPKDGTACQPYPKTQPVCGMCGLLFDSVAPHFGSPKAGQLRGGLL